jgi:5'-phosphate synthase pdxT subunit
VNRNHFGRQVESFQASLDLQFMEPVQQESFPAVFIRAPVVERVLPGQGDGEVDDQNRSETIVAPSRQAKDQAAQEAIGSQVEVLASLPGRAARLASEGKNIDADKEAGDIIAVRQGNVFATSFHPELTGDPRIHSWWLRQVREAAMKRRKA